MNTMGQTRTWIAVAVLTFSGAVGADAQKIEVVDKAGYAVPFASVMTTDATVIGVTGPDGVLADVKGAKTVVVSHVAYQPKTVSVEADGQQVTLDDADFSLPEITVTKKDYTYLQVYYRMVCMSDKDGVVYYRAGIVNNFLNEASGKQESAKQHIAMAKSGILKMLLNLLVGKVIESGAQIKVKPFEEKIQELFPSQGLKIVDKGNGQKDIVDNYGTLGSITDADGRRKIAMDMQQATYHELEAKGNTKELERRKKADSKRENEVNSSYRAYSIDESGHYRPEDFLMEQHLMSFDYESEGHCLIAIDFFATDRGYLSKEGVKQAKKESKVKMTYDYLQQFERQHDIPALAPEVLARMKDLTEKD